MWWWRMFGTSVGERARGERESVGGGSEVSGQLFGQSVVMDGLVFSNLRQPPPAAGSGRHHHTT